MSSQRKFTYYVRRFNPELDQEPYWQSFNINVEPGMTVLDGLHQIKENLDATLSWRFSCRMGVCGSCGMLINGKPSLACNTQILDVSEQALTVAPLPNFKILKDLIPDLHTLFQKHTSIKPFIIREDDEEIDHPTGEFYQSPQDLEKFLQFSYCIKCGMCMAACPTVATDPQYLGPQPLAQSYRYSADCRDGGFGKRKAVVGTPHGIFRCHYAGECSNVCPKGVDPARAIQFMKRELVLNYFRLKKCSKGSQVQSSRGAGQRQPEIPDPPKFTVKQTT